MVVFFRAGEKVVVFELKIPFRFRGESMKGLLVSCLLGFGITLSAAVPNKIVYQGRLSKSGTSVAGVQTFTATLVTDSGDVPLGSFPVTLPATGEFSLAIPLPATAIDWVNGKPKLKISVNGEDLSPIEEFGVTPYALVAKQVDYLSSGDVHLSSSALLSSWQHPTNRDKIDGSKIEGPALNLPPSQVTGTALVSFPEATQVVQPTDTVPALAIKGNGGSTSHTLEIFDSGTPGVSGSTTALQAYFDSIGNLVSNRGVTAVSSNFGSLSVSGGAAAESLMVSNEATAGALHVSGNASLATVSGNVGVGTATPSKKLDVVGGDVQVSGGGLLVSSTTLLATASGNVGVGTVAPSAKLDVGGGLRVSGEALLATSGGNVGIGTISPEQKLHVVGRVRDLTGFLAPVGGILMFGGNIAPEGWLLCNGSAVSRVTYADLFSVVGATFGSGDGVSTFNLPDFRRRVSVGAGGTGTPTLPSSIGATGGEERHILTVAEIPSHTHNYKDLNVNGSAEFPSGDGHFGFGPTEPTGGGQSHNIIQPSLVVNFIIKY